MVYYLYDDNMSKYYIWNYKIDWSYTMSPCYIDQYYIISWLDVLLGFWRETFLCVYSKNIL